MAPTTSTNIFDALATQPETDIEGLPADVVLSKSQKKRMEKREKKAAKEQAVNALLDAFDQDEEDTASTDTPDYGIVSAHAISSASQDDPSPLRCSRLCGFCSQRPDGDIPSTTFEGLVEKELTDDQRARVQAEAEHWEAMKKAQPALTEPQMPKRFRTQSRLEAPVPGPNVKLSEKSIQSLLSQYQSRIARAQGEKKQELASPTRSSHRLTPADWTDYARAATESNDVNQYARLHALTTEDWDVVQQVVTEKPYRLKTVTSPALSRLEEQLPMDGSLLAIFFIIIGILLGYETEAEAVGLCALVAVVLSWLLLICVADWTGWEVFEGGVVEGMRVVYDD